VGVWCYGVCYGCMQKVFQGEVSWGSPIYYPPVYRTKSLSSVKTTAVDQDIYDVAQALVALQEYTLVTVLRVDSALLEEAV